MDLITEHNQRLEPLRTIAGVAMKVHAEYKPGLLESAYEAAMEYLLKQDGHTVERQKPLPIYWKDVRLDQDYRMDLVVDGIIVELKAVKFTNDEHLYSVWYKLYPDGKIEKVKLF